MSRIRIAILLLLVLPACLMADPVSETRVEMPYLQVLGMENVSLLPLTAVEAEVSIAGLIAEVRLSQSFVNLGDSAVEAVYMFPGSPQSAVYGLQMYIADRTIVAEIREKQAAQAEYEEAKADGKSATLLVQNRPNVFQMNVANIPPGETVRVELQYTELLMPVEGVYSFVLPTALGDRYGENKPVAQPKNVPFIAALELAAGMDIQQAISINHPADIRYTAQGVANVSLASDQILGKDFVFQYKLAGKGIGTGLNLYAGETENFFMLQVQPPQAVAPEQIPPREYIFIVDISGSMDGWPIETAQDLMKELVRDLRPEDRFNLIMFASGLHIYHEGGSVEASEAHIEAAMEVLLEKSGGGGTDLLPALELALEQPKKEGLNRSLVIITDGLIDVEKKAINLIRDRLDQANFFAFGVGSNMNRYLIEAMAYAGEGEPIIIEREKDVPALAARFRRYIESPVLTDIQLEIEGFDAYDLNTAAVPDLFAERPVILYGKWKGEPQGEIRLQGNSANARYSQVIEVSMYQPAASNAPLRYLWARDQIRQLSDYGLVIPDSATIKEITQLGLDYNLLTDYTSFVGVDEGPQLNTVNGYSNNTRAGATPEPHEWALMLVLAALVFGLWWRNR